MALQPERVRALLFDLDGTLIETDNQIVARWSGPLARLTRLVGRPDATPLARWLLMQSESPGNALVTLIDRLGLDDPLLRVSDRLHALRGLPAAAEACCVAGVPQLLATLGTRYPLALVTTRGRKTAQALLAAAGIADAFRVLATREDTFYMKPNPAPVRFAAQALGVTPAECLMTGDTTVDILAGRRAGAQTCGVLCGFGERAELVRAGADLILEDTSGLALVLGVTG